MMPNWFGQIRFIKVAKITLSWNDTIVTIIYPIRTQKTESFGYC